MSFDYVITSRNTTTITKLVMPLGYTYIGIKHNEKNSIFCKKSQLKSR